MVRDVFLMKEIDMVSYWKRIAGEVAGAFERRVIRFNLFGFYLDCDVDDGLNIGELRLLL